MCNKQVAFFRASHFLPSLTFFGKATSQGLESSHVRSSTRVGFGVVRKFDKGDGGWKRETHYLSILIIHYDRKKVLVQGPGL